MRLNAIEIDFTVILILKSMQFPTISDEPELNLWKELGLANKAVFSEFWRTMSNNEIFLVQKKA